MSSTEGGMIQIDPELCTGCKRCTKVCPTNAIQGKKGEAQKLRTDLCVMCGQCVQICSVYAAAFDSELTAREEKLCQRGMLASVKEPLFAAYHCGDVRQVRERLADKKQRLVVQCAPAVRVALAEDFGRPFGSLSPGKLATALRAVGFDRVYDTNFAADLTAVEEGHELIRRVTQGGVLPMFTSCCPSWVKYLEQKQPELLPHLSTCKSPQQMAGALFKTYGAQLEQVAPEEIFSVAIMPCTCKKFESERPEMCASGCRDVDAVLTTRELAQLIKEKGIDFDRLLETDFDAPLGLYSGAGMLFGATGGVMEAALRTGYELITKEGIPELAIDLVRGGEGIRKAEVQIGELRLKVVIVSGLAHVEPLLQEVKAGIGEYHFIEVMTCPRGCISGGGQPKVLLPQERETAYELRTDSTYRHDRELLIRKSHNNPAITGLYEDFLKQPLGELSHRLLHTHYTSRVHE